MNWTEPTNPWMRAMRRRQRWWLAGITGGLAVLGGSLTYTFVLLAQVFGELGRTVPIWIIPAFALNAMFAVPMVLGMRRNRRVMRLIPAHDGLICPKCVVELIQDDAEGSTGESAECRKCRRRIGIAECRSYWEQYALAPSSASEWMLEWRVGRLPALLPLMKIRRRPVLGAACMIGLCVGMGMLLSLWQSGSVLRGAFRYTELLFIMSGMGFLGHGLMRRQGDSRHCAKCEFQQIPNAANSSRCPECGANWARRGAIVHGQRVRRPRLVALGALLTLFGVALLGMRSKVQIIGLGLLPTGSLIAEVTAAPRGFTSAEWSELNKRTLNPDQQRRLAKGLLDSRLRRGHMAGDADNWFARMITAGELAPNLIGRYYGEMLETWIVAPITAKVGETITLATGGRHRHSSSSNRKLAVYVSGFFIDGDPNPHGRSTSGIAGVMFGEERISFTEEREPGAGPRVEIVAERPGPLRIRLVLLVAAVPDGTASFTSIVWGSDGAAILPKSATWSERREIEHVVQVER